MRLRDIGMLKPAVSDMWVWVLDDASTPEIENVLNFSLRGCSLLKKTLKKRDFEVLAGVFWDLQNVELFQRAMGDQFIIQ